MDRKFKQFKANGMVHLPFSMLPLPNRWGLFSHTKKFSTILQCPVIQFRFNISVGPFQLRLPQIAGLNHKRWVTRLLSLFRSQSQLDAHMLPPQLIVTSHSTQKALPTLMSFIRKDAVKGRNEEPDGEVHESCVFVAAPAQLGYIVIQTRGCITNPETLNPVIWRI